MFLSIDKQNFNLSEFKMSAKVKSTIKESVTSIPTYNIE